MTDPAALVIRRQFSNGQSLTGTPDHLVWTENRGFTAMDALNWDDILCTWKTSAGFKTSSTFATPKVAPRLRNATTRLVEAARSVRGCFIEKSGRRRMAVSREAETSTTWTATGSTTSWEICAASLMQNTLNSMRAQLQPKPAGIWHAFVCWLRSGTEVALDWLGIPSMVERLGKIESLCFEFAPAAASSTALSTFARSRDSVLASASCGITSRRRDSTKHAAAQFASLRSQSRNQSSSEHAPVRAGKSFDVVERMPVYDLTVAGAHEYFANGVLVHNCDALVWAAAELMGRRGPSPRDLYGPEGLVARS
jgi:Intein/homing endonuclease